MTTMASSSEKSVHSLAGKHIIVAGAGLAGLAFVRGLHRNWQEGSPRPRITVYERDPRELPSQRGNYSLGLRSDTGGLQALQRLGLFDSVFEYRTPGTDVNAVVIRDANWNTLVQMREPSIPRDQLPITSMRITRHDIRECFVQGVADEADLRWEVACTSAARLKDGRMEVRLSDGSTDECDLLIVADGASSKIRKSLRPDDTLNFAGVVLIGGLATFPSFEESPRQLKEAFGPVIGGDGHSLFIFQTAASSWVWFLTRRMSTPRTPVKDEEALAMKEQIIEEALREGKCFAEPFPTIVAHTDPASLKIVNAQDKPPISHKEIGHDAVVYVGDANHAISPFAGNGANNAIIDGLSLGKELSNSPTVSTAIAAFDKESLPRTKGTLKTSHVVIWAAHSTGLGLWCVLLFMKVLNLITRGPREVIARLFITPKKS